MASPPPGRAPVELRRGNDRAAPTRKAVPA